MTPYDIMGWVFAAVVGTILIRFAIGHKRPAPVTDEVKTERVDDAQVTTLRAMSASNVAKSYPGRANMTFEKINNTPRPVGKHPALSAPYGHRQPTVALTPRMIERVNTERFRRGAPQLNREGIQSAIAHPWDRYDVRQPTTSNEWLTYLILYEVFIAEHHQSHCGGTGGFTIDPSQPYNGQGGEFAGAGASGDWTNSPSAASVAAGIAVGASAGYLASQADAVVSAYQRSDAAFDGGSVSSAPDPSPASAPDTGSSGGGDGS